MWIFGSSCTHYTLSWIIIYLCCFLLDFVRATVVSTFASSPYDLVKTPSVSGSRRLEVYMAYSATCPHRAISPLVPSKLDPSAPSPVFKKGCMTQTSMA